MPLSAAPSFNPYRQSNGCAKLAAMQRSQGGGRGVLCPGRAPGGNPMRLLRPVAAALFAVILMPATGKGQTPPVLQLQGQPYSQGSMTLHFTADAGAPSLIFYGLNPLDPPFQTAKGPFFVGTVFNIVFLGTIPPEGRLDIAFALPPIDPILAGIPMVMQGMVPGSVTNPATLPLDQPYFEHQDAVVIPNPNPTQQANFGDRSAFGDLNADGEIDLVVGAWFEDYLGVDKAGRVYVLWGPDWTAYTTLEPSIPAVFATFGANVAVTDLDGDGVDDLIVAETLEDPPPANGTAWLHVYAGSSTFVTVPALSVASWGGGVANALFGRCLAIGDFDGDTYIDFAVGLANAPIGALVNAGRIDVFWGPDFSTRTEITGPAPAQNDFFGSAIVAIDVNADGLVDLVEGSGRANLPGATQSGKVHVLIGPDLQVLATIPNPLALSNARFAEGLHAADLDGDGFPEIIAADVKNRLFVLPGPTWTTHLLRTKPPAQYQNPFGENSFGYFIDDLDANGDGVPDIAIADPFSGALTGCFPGAEGTGYVALGPYYATFLPLFEPQPGCADGFSWGLYCADIDGDGHPEIIAGSPTADAGSILNAGRLTVLK
ncbi:MAG: FG-GAP-like repeat-containing protein [Planctomycetota bacterium]